MVASLSAVGYSPYSNWMAGLDPQQIDPRLLQQLEALLPGFSDQDTFERVRGEGGKRDQANNPLNLDAQSILELALMLLQKIQSEQNSQPPPPRNVGSIGSSSPSWSGSPQPTSWNGSSGGTTGTSSGTSSGTTGTTGTTSTAAPAAVHGLKGNDKKTAEFINKHLADQGSPAAEAKNPSAGEMMVDAGKKHNVDPLVLLSIAGHETGFGKLGVGMQKMLGVSAYDSDPSNVNPKFDGLRNQIYAGAETFANLREKGGASANDDITKQLQAANQAGWATDPNWHAGVGRHYSEISEAAAKFSPPSETSGGNKSVKEAAQALLDNPNVQFWDGLSTGSDRKMLEQIAKTGKAFVPATGETVEPSANMMRALVEMAEKGPIMINALTGGSHSTNSNHYHGMAVDLDISVGNAAQIEAIANKYGGTRNSETDHIHLDF